MQVWDIVKVKQEGEFNGQAGRVLAVDQANGTAKVKLDLHAAPQVFLFTELDFLSR